MSDISGDASWSITATGLTPSDYPAGLECSSQWTPSDASPGYNTGFNSQKIKANGTIKFTMDLETLRNSSERPGTLRAWIREAGTLFDADPIMLDSGPAVVELRLP